jgi:AraC-like DNA-binding protein
MMASAQRQPQAMHPGHGLPESYDPARLAFAFRYYRHLARVRRYVDEHHDQPVGLREVAASIGLSPSRLSHLFTEKAGLPFQVWIRLDRVHRARELLSATDMSVTEVTYRVGFQSLRSFERAFKRFTGMTALEFRRRVIASRMR